MGGMIHESTVLFRAERRNLYAGFSELTLSGKLYQHLAETDHACKERVELIIWQMKGREGVTEALKVADQFEWIRRMNSIYNRAEEIVLNELVYC